MSLWWKKPELIEIWTNYQDAIAVQIWKRMSKAPSLPPLNIVSRTFVRRKYHILKIRTCICKTQASSAADPARPTLKRSNAHSNKIKLLRECGSSSFAACSPYTVQLCRASPRATQLSLELRVSMTRNICKRSKLWAPAFDNHEQSCCVHTFTWWFGMEIL